jgi:uncharacterized protein (TIGR00369 family)
MDGTMAGLAEMAEITGLKVGIASRDQLAGQSGLDILRGYISGELPSPPMGVAMNFWIGEADEGRVIFLGEPTEQHLNPMGGVHGGWALAAIDSVTGCAALSTLEPGIGYATIETRGNLVRPIKPNSGIYRAEGRVLTRGRQIITADAFLTDPDGKLYAHGTSTLMVQRP